MAKPTVKLARDDEVAEVAQLNITNQLRVAGAVVSNEIPLAATSIARSLHALYKETEINSASQVNGQVDVAGFFDKAIVPIAMVAKVTQVFLDDQGGNGFTLGFANQSIFDTPTGGTLGAIFGPSSYSSAKGFPYMFTTQDSSEPLRLQTLETSFTTGKLIVGMWYFGVTT